MSGAARTIESCADWAAAILLACAVGFALVVLTGSPAGSAAGSALALLATPLLLRKAGSARKDILLPVFDVPAFEPEVTDELLLTPEMMADAANVLILEDILARLGPESRVVRLFEQPKLPAAGELKADIDRDLRKASEGPNPSDASQALHDALAELRKSLR